MTSKITKILSDEHQNILKVVETLDDRCNQVQSGEEIDRKFFLDTINFIRNYADKFHHAKEEEILFKELCKPGVEMHCNPIEMMLYEHEQGRNFVKEMEQGVKEENKTKIISGARGYIQLIKEHIFKEDNILYPMADEALNKKTQQEMLKRFEKVEREKREDKKKYLNFVRSLK